MNNQKKTKQKKKLYLQQFIITLDRENGNFLVEERKTAKVNDKDFLNIFEGGNNEKLG